MNIIKVITKKEKNVAGYNYKGESDSPYTNILAVYIATTRNKGRRLSLVDNKNIRKDTGYYLCEVRGLGKIKIRW